MNTNNEFFVQDDSEYEILKEENFEKLPLELQEKIIDMLKLTNKDIKRDDKKTA